MLRGQFNGERMVMFMEVASFKGGRMVMLHRWLV